jgi:hypothetical protein
VRGDPKPVVGATRSTDRPSGDDRKITGELTRTIRLGSEAVRAGAAIASMIVAMQIAVTVSCRMYRPKVFL